MEFVDGVADVLEVALAERPPDALAPHGGDPVAAGGDLERGRVDRFRVQRAEALAVGVGELGTPERGAPGGLGVVDGKWARLFRMTSLSLAQFRVMAHSTLSGFQTSYSSMVSRSMSNQTDGSIAPASQNCDAGDRVHPQAAVARGTGRSRALVSALRVSRCSRAAVV